MPKFKPGDKARIIDRGGVIRPEYRWIIGHAVTINAGPLPIPRAVTAFTGESVGYNFYFRSILYHLGESSLEPITKPLLGSWKAIEEFSSWNPTKENTNGKFN